MIQSCRYIEKACLKKSLNRNFNLGVPIVAQQKQIQLGTGRLRVWSLASLRGLRIWCCCELWYRSADAAQILSCCDFGLGQRLTAPFGSLAWELPYATGAALKKAKNKTKQKNKKNPFTYFVIYRLQCSSILIFMTYFYNSCLFYIKRK